MSLCGVTFTVAEAKEIFDQWDTDDSGCVSKQELLNVLNALADKMNIDKDECKASTGDIIAKADSMGDKDGRMTFDEFKALLGL